MLKSLFAAFLLFIGLLSVVQAENIAVPAIDKRITDLTATLSSAQKSHIEQLLTDLEKTQGSQLAVLIIPTTQPESIEDYAMRVVEKWKLGRKNIDDGVLLLIAKNDRKIRIEVGYGLEGAIPDISAGRIINEFIGPEFRRGRFHEGVLAGIGQLSNLIKGEALPAPSTTQGVGNSYGGNGIDTIVFIFIFLSVFLRALVGRLIFAVVLTLGGALLVWFLTHNLLFVLFAAIFLGLFSFSSSTSGGSHYQTGGSSGGGGFSSGGGFSGGGGSFGGGGASGGW